VTDFISDVIGVSKFSQWRFVYQIQLAHLPPNEDLWSVLLLVIEA